MMRYLVPLMWVLSALGADKSIEISAEDLSNEITQKIQSVNEFRFMQEESKKLGIRVWLFGGTAAGFGHYVRWDLQRRAGDKTLQPNRFDYHFSNIYRSSQDADIVIDGDESQAQKLEAALVQKFPHLQGSKSAWEVRLLRAKRGDKEALLNNPDFHNQHTDSNSTGLIELTSPTEGSVVRDLREWSNPTPTFLDDLRTGAIHFYKSDGHDKTSRFVRGMNPPIIAAVRYLTKVFQYDLQIDPKDMAEIKAIIDHFNPSEVKAGSYVSHWLEKNGTKLFENSVDVEKAWNLLEKVGLRQKLIQVRNTPGEINTLSWWMNKSPLPSFEVGKGTGRTAKDLGLEMVAHETKDIHTLEIITRSHLGVPNVFQSGARVGEAASQGDGFYTAVGREGGRGNGMTIRFSIDPNARLGTDFELGTRRGDGTSVSEHDHIIIKNRNAFKVIPESLSISPKEYFRLLARGFWDAQADRGVAYRQFERAKRDLHSQTPTQQEELLKAVEEMLAFPTKNMTEIIGRWFALPMSQTHPEFIERILPRVVKSGEGMAALISELAKDAWFKNPVHQPLIEKVVLSLDGQEMFNAFHYFKMGKALSSPIFFLNERTTRKLAELTTRFYDDQVWWVRHQGDPSWGKANKKIDVTDVVKLRAQVPANLFELFFQLHGKAPLLRALIDETDNYTNSRHDLSEAHLILDQMEDPQLTRDEKLTLQYWFGERFLLTEYHPNPHRVALFVRFVKIADPEILKAPNFIRGVLYQRPGPYCKGFFDGHYKGLMELTGWSPSINKVKNLILNKTATGYEVLRGPSFWNRCAAQVRQLVQ